MAQRLMCMLTALLAVGPLRAEPLADPTRPAVGVQPGMPTPGAAGGPRLQMIKVGAGRASAIVDGQEVNVGSRVGDMRVTQITESEVVLKNKSETEVLRLFPNMEKHPVGGNKEGDARASRKARK